MQVSPQARRALIESFEGLRQIAYRDCVGVWTIGYGHTSVAGAPRVSPGLRITAQAADAALARDLARVEAGVARSLRVAPAQCEFDALVSFAYNCGLGALRSSSLLRLYNRREIEAAANAFLDWMRCGGRVVPGLVRRREAERAWFLDRAQGEPAAPVDLAHRVDRPEALTAQIGNRVALAFRPRPAA